MSARARLREILDYPCDLVAECDRCGVLGPLWEDLDSDEPDAGWAYCAECWEQKVKEDRA